MAWDATLIDGEHAGWILDHDPVLRCVRALLADAQLTQDEIIEVDTRVVEEMGEARAYALASPPPDSGAVFEGAFARP